MERASKARKAASAGRRRAHLEARSNGPEGRARMDSPRAKRPRSSARAEDEEYRRRGSFSRQVRQIVSRSAQIPERTRVGLGGSTVRINSRISSGLGPRKG